MYFQNQFVSSIIIRKLWLTELRVFAMSIVTNKPCLFNISSRLPINLPLFLMKFLFMDAVWFSETMQGKNKRTMQGNNTLKETLWNEFRDYKKQIEWSKFYDESLIFKFVLCQSYSYLRFWRAELLYFIGFFLTSDKKRFFISFKKVP